MKNISPMKFYVLSFTWGLPMSIVGAVVCGVLLCFGYKPKRYGHCCHIEIGKGWGGLNLGWVFLTGKDASVSTKNHELGHAYQNACLLGWVFPFFTIISATRYWLKRFGAKFYYYKWWFEAQASKIGAEVMNYEPK